MIYYPQDLIFPYLTHTLSWQDYWWLGRYWYLLNSCNLKYNWWATLNLANVEKSVNSTRHSTRKIMMIRRSLSKKLSRRWLSEKIYLHFSSPCWNALNTTIFRSKNSYTSTLSTTQGPDPMMPSWPSHPSEKMQPTRPIPSSEHSPSEPWVH